MRAASIIPIPSPAHSFLVPLPTQLCLLQLCKTPLKDDPLTGQPSNTACPVLPSSLRLSITSLPLCFVLFLHPPSLLLHHVLSAFLSLDHTRSWNQVFSVAMLYFCMIVSVQVYLIIMYILTLDFMVD